MVIHRFMLKYLIFVYFYQTCYSYIYTHSHGVRENQVKAKMICQKKGPGWTLPEGNINNPELIDFMKTNKLNCIWIQVRRAKLPKWQWINGSDCK